MTLNHNHFSQVSLPTDLLVIRPDRAARKRPASSPEKPFAGQKTPGTCTGAAVPTLEHRQAVRDILKASADLGRLGGLLKLALSEKGEGGDKLALQRLLREIEAGQLQLKNAARNIR